MRRRSKAILTLTLLALYAGTMLFGQGLHLLTCDHDAPIACGCQHGISGAERDFSPADASSLATNAHDEHHSDCLICQFYSLGHVAPPAAALCVRPVAVAEIDSALHSIVPFDRTVAYSPQAPPLG